MQELKRYSLSELKTLPLTGSYPANLKVNSDGTRPTICQRLLEDGTHLHVDEEHAEYHTDYDNQWIRCKMEPASRLRHLNLNGTELKEWDLASEDENHLTLKDPVTGGFFNIRKSSFELSCEKAGATREGDKFFIPVH